MQRLRLTLISHVEKFARRSKVLSDLNSLRKTSCVRSSASSWRPTNLSAMLKILRQCRCTIASHAAWSPLRQRSIRTSISCGAGVAASAVIRDVRSFDGGNARMITCDSLVYQPFQPAGDALACDGVSIQSIVEHAGTPTYIYSARAIRESYRAIDDAFAPYPHAIHYGMKANSTVAIMRLLRSLGSRADANSAGEIVVAQRARVAPA